MRFRLLADRAFWSLLARLLARGSLVVASMILARRLSATDFAAYSYFQLTIAVLATYATFGMSVTASKFFAEEQVAQENTQPALGTLWVLSILAGSVFALLIFLVPAEFVGAGLPVPRYLLAVGLLALALCVVPDGGILGLEKYRAAVVTEILSASTVISGAAFAAATDAPLVAMWSLVLAAVVRSVGNTVIVVRQIGWKKIARGLTVDRATLSRILSFMGPMTCVSMLAASGPWLIGRILLRSDDGPEHFALYAIGLQWFALALFLPGAISRVALPFFVRILASPNADTASGAAAVRFMAWTSFMAGGIVCVIAAMLSPWL
jgi:O-antigen/teichoic acid export membrane protein